MDDNWIIKKEMNHRKYTNYCQEEKIYLYHKSCNKKRTPYPGLCSPIGNVCLDCFEQPPNYILFQYRLLNGK